MLRLFVFLLLAFIVLLIVRAYLAGKRQRGGRPGDRGEDMVLDPQCLSYVSKREAVFKADLYFCSDECARLYLSR